MERFGASAGALLLAACAAGSGTIALLGAHRPAITPHAGAVAGGGDPRDEVEPLPPVTRLLDRLDRARLEAPAAAPFFAAAEGELGPPAEGMLAFVDEFALDAPFPGPWRARAFVEAALESGAAALSLPARVERPKAFTAPSSAGEPASGAPRDVVEIAADDLLGGAVAADAGATWLVRAWVQPLAPPRATSDANGAADGSIHREAAAEPPPEPSLSFVPLDHLPRGGDDFATDLQAHAAEFLRRPRDVALPPTAATDAWHELRALARPYPGRQALALALNGGSRGLRVDRVEVRRLTPTEALALAHDETVEPVTHPLRRRIELDLETWDCLALPLPGALEFDLHLPAAAPRLDFALALLADGTIAAAGAGAGSTPAAATVRLELTVTSAHGTTTLPPLEAGRRFVGATRDLAPFADTTVTLRLAAHGPAGAVALIGAPTLLSSERAAPPAAAGTAAPARHVIVLSLDTLRADHVGCYDGCAATPAIDALAAAGTRFARVFSPASYTLPTHLSLFSGQDPLVHETVASTDPMDPLRTLPLAARLRAEGWRTAAFTAGGLVHPRYGFGVGFDRYSIRDPGGVVGLHRRIGDASDDDAQPGEDRMQAVLDWLAAGRDVPSFLFLHTYLVHNYRPHQPWLDRIGGGTRPSPEELAQLRAKAEQGHAPSIERLKALYHASVLQADAEIVGRLLAGLEQLGLRERTLIALVSDHGEEFFEHRMIGHGDELWHTLTQVPWIVAGPGVARGAVVETPVALADVAPTLAGRLGLPPDPRVLACDRLAPDEGGAGASGDGADDGRDALTLSLRRIAARPDQDALVLWPWKLVRRRTAEKPWPVALYRLDEDPDETRDRAAEQPARVAGMTRRLDARLADFERQKAALPRSEGSRQFELSPELERMLDQLGYAQGGDE
ncbi:MAG: sulfatase [Planctomycetes bacterium]|nr:sulfatase [Planctomycetota bacterium]